MVDTPARVGSKRKSQVLDTEGEVDRTAEAVASGSIFVFNNPFCQQRDENLNLGSTRWPGTMAGEKATSHGSLLFTYARPQTKLILGHPALFPRDGEECRVSRVATAGSCSKRGNVYR